MVHICIRIGNAVEFVDIAQVTRRCRGIDGHWRMATVPMVTYTYIIWHSSPTPPVDI